MDEHIERQAWKDKPKNPKVWNVSQIPSAHTVDIQDSNPATTKWAYWGWQWISQHSSTREWWVNFPSGQADLQLTCPDGQVEILEKYQKYCNILPHIFNFEVLPWFTSKLGMLIFIRAS